MSNCAIVGINWGDEGKGRMVDLVTADYDVVVRYQGTFSSFGSRTIRTLSTLRSAIFSTVTSRPSETK